MIKAVIQIPCYNEEETLGITLSELPRKIPGIDVVEWLVIDDGCTDNTVEVAKAHGVDHIVSLTSNSGLARAFMVGLDASLSKGADIIINTDADKQYCADDIPKLVQPILDKKAEIKPAPGQNLRYVAIADSFSVEEWAVSLLGKETRTLNGEAEIMTTWCPEMAEA